MRSQRTTIFESAILLANETKCDGIFLFLNTSEACRWFLKSGFVERANIVLVIPGEMKLAGPMPGIKNVKMIRSWSGNQTRFSRIKYAFLHGVADRIIETDSRVVCLLGPWGNSHLDTIAIHDLSLSWSDEFPFNPKSIMHNQSFTTVLAIVDIALDIGALGREGKPVGTVFIIGDSEEVMELSHQAVFNPFKGYPKRERGIARSEVAESIKELSTLDGAFVISGDGIAMAAGRHLDAKGVVTKQLRGLGSRHRSAAGITRATSAVAVVVSESNGRVTIFEKGRIVSTLEPVISSRMV